MATKLTGSRKLLWDQIGVDFQKKKKIYMRGSLLFQCTVVCKKMVGNVHHFKMSLQHFKKGFLIICLQKCIKLTISKEAIVFKHISTYLIWFTRNQIIFYIGKRDWICRGFDFLFSPPSWNKIRSTFHLTENWWYSIWLESSSLRCFNKVSFYKMFTAYYSCFWWRFPVSQTWKIKGRR